MADGALSFYSWVRRGLAATVATEAGDTTSIASITLGFNDDADLTVTPRLELIGPGDIVGLSSSVVVRTWPKAEDHDAEFVSYALIELDQADLLWRYSPERAGEHVRPWLTLVVLASDECSLAQATPEQKLAVLTVNDVADLPSDADFWAWAHTQFAGQGLSEQAIKDQITGKPGLFTGRLMSPRLLTKNVEYFACLVPTFERGRLAGLGRLDPKAPSGSTNPPALSLWDRSDTADGGFKLPVYFSWRFTTGSIGNFEQAARLLQPFILPETMGRRDMDVSRPGLDLLPAAEGSLPVEGALMSVAAAEAEPPTWPEPGRQAFIDDLAGVLNVNAEGAEAELVPPLYAQWYAADARLDAPDPTGTNPVWFFELNSDPRNRVAAALGTTVIQREQQALLASGWDQVGELRDVNEQSRVLQLARGLLNRIWVRHFSTAELQRFYHLTLRLHAWVTCGSNTVCGNVKNSAIVPGFLSAQWLRWTRPRGAIGLLQGRPGLGSNFVPDLIDRLNACQRPAPEPPSPPGRHTPDDPRGGLFCEDIEVLVTLGSTVTEFWGLVLLWVVRRLLVTQNGDCWWLAMKALRYAIILIRVSVSGEEARRRCKLITQGITGQDILSAPKLSGFSVPAVTLPSVLPLPPVPSGTSDSPDALALRDALFRLQQAFQLPPALTCKPPMDLEQCRLALVTRLEPELTVGEIFLERRHVELEWDPKDPLEPIFAAPEYERPMYLPLSQISSDWILPGLNDMKRDTVGLAVTNQRFVEAYMAGLNHEMTRELLWNEFPTDQRGTYFRQFWDVAGHMLENGSKLPPDQLRDINPLRRWPADAPLGGNSPRPPPHGDSEQQFLVLVVRAQLIQKYPNVIVYLQQRETATGRLTGAQRHPIFYALIEPDTAFYGFDITADDVRGDSSLYFVLQEQPGEPKFADEATDRDTSTYTNPASPVDLGPNAGVVAETTFHQPFRLGIQGIALLPLRAQP